MPSLSSRIAVPTCPLSCASRRRTPGPSGPAPAVRAFRPAFHDPATSLPRTRQDPRSRRGLSAQLRRRTAIQSVQGLGGEGAGGAKRAIVVEIIEHGGQAHAEHLPADVAQQLRHEYAAESSEAGVLVAEAGAAGAGLEPVNDLCHVAAFVAGPRVTQQRRLVHLEHLAIDDTAPAGLRLGDELEPRAYGGGDSFRPPARAGRGPQRDKRRVGHGPPDFRRGMGVVTHDTDLTHGNSFGQPIDGAGLIFKLLKKYSNVNKGG